MVNQKAKLIWDDIRYFEEDLNEICKKEAKFMGGLLRSYRLDRVNNTIIFVMDKKGSLSEVTIPFGALKLYKRGIPVKEKNFVLKYNGKGYVANEIFQIGNEMALLWGGSCIGYNIDKKAGVIVFDCVEHGENFTTELKVYELKSPTYANYGTLLK